MKNILLLVFVFTITTSVFSQTGCGSQFFDNGGITGDYLPNTDQTTTICPVNAGDYVSLTFLSFDTEAAHDGMYIYNGVDISSPQIASINPAGSVPGGVSGSYWGTTNPGTITSTSQTGCLTIRFRSDATVQKPGWLANVNCGPVTQGFILNAFLDLNGNGARDFGENNFPIGTYHYEKNSDGNIYYGVSTNGYYSFFEDNPANHYTIGYTIDSAYSSLYTIAVPEYTGLNVGTSMGLVTVNFPIVPVVNYNDLDVHVFDLNVPKAGFNSDKYPEALLRG